MSLSRKLAKLEVVVRARGEDAAPTSWTEERETDWWNWVAHIVATMPEDAARRAVTELWTLDRAAWGPIATRLDHMAYLGVEGLYDGGYFHGGRVVALPAEVCAVLEANPDARWSSDFSCEDCGLETPHRSHEEMGRLAEQLRAEGRAVTPADRALMTTCPLCGGAVAWAGFTTKKTREAWRRQVAEDS